MGVSGWISVRDRMPDDGQRVLCCLMEGPEEPRTPFYVIARKGRGRQVLGWFLGNGSVETVGDDDPNAWWMPLPDAPEGDGAK